MKIDNKILWFFFLQQFSFLIDLIFYEKKPCVLKTRLTFTPLFLVSSVTSIWAHCLIRSKLSLICFEKCYCLNEVPICSELHEWNRDLFGRIISEREILYQIKILLVRERCWMEQSTHKDVTFISWKSFFILM